ALTFMGACYWLVPRMAGRQLELGLLAKVQPYLWFLGMSFFSFTGHIAGLMGLPRRVYETNYAGASQARGWEGLTNASAVGGLILHVSAMFFVLVMIATVFAGKRVEPAPVGGSEPLGEPGRPGIWDRLGLWFVIAVVLVIIAYAIPLSNILQMTRYGSQG